MDNKALAAVLLVGLLALAAAGYARQQPTFELQPSSYHMIQPGDTLWVIAGTYYPDMPRERGVWLLREANPTVDPGALRPGTSLRIPERS